MRFLSNNSADALRYSYMCSCEYFALRFYDQVLFSCPMRSASIMVAGRMRSGRILILIPTITKQPLLMLQLPELMFLLCKVIGDRSIKPLIDEKGPTNYVLAMLCVLPEQVKECPMFRRFWHSSGHTLYVLHMYLLTKTRGSKDFLINLFHGNLGPNSQIFMQHNALTTASFNFLNPF